MTFEDLKLNTSILEAVDHMGFVNATPIQEFAIPKILGGYDLIACAQTGTGKTAAFILPILHKITGRQETSVNTLIIVPTRELAIQIDQEIQGLSYFVSVGSMAIYGGGDGKNWNIQKEALTKGRDIIVATPGKLLSHLNLGYVDFSKVEHLVLDEADKMLDMGFSDDLTRIFSFLPKKRQNLLFSATMPPKIKILAQQLLTDPEEIILSTSKPAEGVTQQVYLSFDSQKNDLLKYIIEQRPNFTSIIIFTSSKSKVYEISQALRRNGIKSKGVSSNLEQEEREEVLRGFRSKRTRILVATDVMSRGIDIKDINLVVNYDCPRDAEDYIHRIGRTARANTKGEAITLVNEKDMPKLSRIERLIQADITKLEMPEFLGAAPIWKKSGGQAGGKNHGKKRPFYNKNKPKKK